MGDYKCIGRLCISVIEKSFFVSNILRELKKTEKKIIQTIRTRNIL